MQKINKLIIRVFKIYTLVFFSIIFLSASFEELFSLWPIAFIFWFLFIFLILGIEVYLWMRKDNTSEETSSGTVKRSKMFLAVIMLTWAFLVFVAPRFYFDFVISPGQEIFTVNKAVEKKNPSLCGRLRMEPLFLPMGVIFGGATSEYFMNSCYRQVAERLRDENICNFISQISFGYVNYFRLNDCLLSVAKVKNDPNICDNTKGGEEKMAYCLEKFNKN